MGWVSSAFLSERRVQTVNGHPDFGAIGQVSAHKRQMTCGNSMAALRCDSVIESAKIARSEI